MYLWFSNSIECKTAITQGVYKVMSIMIEILESILYYKWTTFRTWSLDICQAKHNVFHFETQFYFISNSTFLTQLLLLCGRFY